MTYSTGRHTRGPDPKDRLASASGPAAAMALTFIVPAVAAAFVTFLSAGVHLIDGHGKSQFQDTARRVLFLDGFMLTVFGAFLASAAFTGFVPGSRRLARLLGVLCGVL